MYTVSGAVVASLVSINEVDLRRARLVLGWVTMSGFDSRRRHFMSVCKQSPRSTQPSTLRGTVKWVPAKGRWCSAAGEWRQARCNLQVKLCDPCLSAIEVVTTMRYTNRRILYFTLLYFTPMMQYYMTQSFVKIKGKTSSLKPKFNPNG